MYGYRNCTSVVSCKCNMPGHSCRPWLLLVYLSYLSYFHNTSYRQVVLSDYLNGLYLQAKKQKVPAGTKKSGAVERVTKTTEKVEPKVKIILFLV